MKKKITKIKLMAALAAVMFCGTTAFGQQSGQIQGSTASWGDLYHYNAGNTYKVGINTNSPAYVLDVVGDINIPTGSAYKQNGNNILKIQATGSTFVGDRAGNSTTGNYNTFSGYQSGYTNSTGTGNTFNGYVSGYTNSTGGGNTFMGYASGYNSTASYNTFIGSSAGYTNSTGQRNTAVGYYALVYNTEGNYNTIMGYEAGKNATTASGNTIIGYQAGQNSTLTGGYNTIMGYASGNKNTTGNSNLFTGTMSGYSNTTGNQNTFLGYGAGYTNQTSSSNVFLGYKAGYNHTTGDNYFYLANKDHGANEQTQSLLYGRFYDSGDPLLTVNGKLFVARNEDGAGLDLVTFDRTSASPVDADYYNVLLRHENDNNEQVNFGQIRLIANDVSDGTEDGELTFSNMVNGTLTEAMRIDETGNVGIGTTNPYSYYKLDVETSNSNSGAIFAKNTSTSGSLGIYAEATGDGASNNVAISGYASYGEMNVGGSFSGESVDDNAIGIGVLSYGQGSSYLEGNTNYGVYTMGLDAETCYGVWANAAGSETNVGIYAEGDNSGQSGADDFAGYFEGDVHINGIATCSDNAWNGSDIKLKKDINPLENSMEKIMRLKPKTYFSRVEEFPQLNLTEGKKIGLIAQDLEEVFPELVRNVKLPEIRDKEGKVRCDSMEFKAINYTSLIPILIAGMQEQQAIIEKLEKKIEKLTGENGTKGSTSDNGSNDNGINGNNGLETGEAQLFQNNPNPFTEQTEIGYYLPENTANANMLIFDMNGKQIKSYSLASTGNGKLVINGGELEAGMYIYSLIADGKEIGTKRMILTNN